MQNERQNLIDAETLTHTTTYGLAELLDLPRDQNLEATDSLGSYDLPSFEKEALLNQALTCRPEIRSLNSRMRIARLSVDAAREERLPQLDLSGFWSYQAEHFANAIPAYTYAGFCSFPSSRAAEFTRKRRAPS